MFRSWLRPGRVAAVLAVAVALAAGRSPRRPDPALGCKNVIKGTAASETLDGTPAADRMLGLAETIACSARRGNDCLDGGLDNDELIGGAGDDRLEGPDRRRMCSRGDAGADELMGQEGADRLDGGAGADRLCRRRRRRLSSCGGAGATCSRARAAPTASMGAPARQVERRPGQRRHPEVPDGYPPAESLDWGHNQDRGRRRARPARSRERPA